MSHFGKLRVAFSFAAAIGALGYASAGLSQPQQEPTANDPRVTVSANCPELLIFSIDEVRYQGLIPTWAFSYRNYSSNRYKIYYDVTYTQRFDGVLMRGRREQKTVEQSLVVRPVPRGKYRQRMIIDKTPTSISVVESIDSLEVYKCEIT